MVSNVRDLIIIKLRTSINPLTKKYYTLETIGDKFNISRERVRQVLTKYPEVPNKINVNLIHTYICKRCGKEIFSHKTQIIRYCDDVCRKANRKYSSARERFHARYLRQVEKGYFKEYYHRPEVIERRREYNQLDKVREYHRRWSREHYKLKKGQDSTSVETISQK